MRSLAPPSARLFGIHWCAGMCALLALAGCSNLSGSDTQPNRYAALNIAAKNAGATAATGEATLVFFQGINVAVPTSALQQVDQCIISGVDTGAVSVTGMNRIDGTPTLSVSTRNVPFSYNTTRLRYETTAASPFSYNAGESATVTIPESGSVFPAGTLTVKLAEPIALEAPTLPAANAEWTVRWNGTNDDVSSIQLQLRYATSGGATSPNEQVYCVLKDDGSVTLPASYLTGFLASPPAARSLRILRWRTNERVIDRNTLLHITSTVDTIATFP